MGKKDARTGARVSFTQEPRQNGKVLFRGWIRRGGLQWRVSALTRAECEGKVRAKLAELEAEGVSAASMDIDEKRDAMRARHILGDGETLESAVEELRAVRQLLGSRRKLADTLDELQRVMAMLGGRCTLTQAAAFWAKHHPDGEVVTLERVCEEFLKPDNRKKGGASPGHLRSLTHKTGKLVDVFGRDTPVASIMPDDVVMFMQGLAETEKWAPLTFNHWLTELKGLFGYADRRYHTGNPAAGIEPKKVLQRDIRYFTPDEAERLLRAAEKVAPDYAAATAILLFAGVRPAELVGQYDLAGGAGKIGGLDWNKVDMDEREIVLDKTKTGQRRTVPISSNLGGWLERYGKPRGPVVPNPTAWRRARARIEKAAGVKWGPDFARHSFATYHYALHRNRDALEAAMGHVEGGSAVLERHYKGLERKSEAEKFWNIMPTAEGGVR